MTLAAALRRPGAFRLMTGFGLSTAGGVFLGLIGPFGLYLNDDLPMRVAYSVGSFWIASLLFAIAIPAAARWAQRTATPMWLWAPLTVAVISIPVAAVSRVAALALWPWLSQHVGLLEWYGQSLTISAAAVGAGVLFLRALEPPRAASVVKAVSSDRASLRPGSEVLCLQMEDHYVRVHTPIGSELILMSMAQAVAAMGSRDGLRVHRSWWVSRHGVEDVVRDGRNLRLRLTSGIEVPIARAKIAELRSAGWLPREV